MSEDGGKPTIVGSLDMDKEKDRALLRRNLKSGDDKHKRWGSITDEKKRHYLIALDVALQLAVEKQDHRGINGCIKTLALVEGQNQADEHLEIRIESEKSGTDRSIIRDAQAILDPAQAEKLAAMAEELSGKLGDA